jgi:hypothetical protein
MAPRRVVKHPRWTLLVMLPMLVFIPAGQRAGAIADPPHDPTIVMHRFTSDSSGAPQVEEAVSACRSNPRLVLGASDDGRALREPARGVVTWGLSDTGGALAKDGPLPPVVVAGTAVTSIADPAVAVGPGSDCGMYAAALIGTGTPDTTGNLVSAVGGFYSPRQHLTGPCQGASCWPTARAVAVAPPGRFYDKEWFAVGNSGAAGTVAWFVWTDRPADDPTSGVAMAARCTADLSSCTAPQRLSDPGDGDPEFADVVVAPSGSTYLLWRALSGTGDTTTMTVKMRVAPPGVTVLGPTRIVATDPHVIPLGGRLNGNDFLHADVYPKLDAATLPNGTDRVFVTWETCGARVDTVCENSRVVLTWSDTAGTRWTPPTVVTPTGPGNRYFPTISVDPTTQRLAIAYYSTELDPTYDSGQDLFTEIWDIVHPHRIARYRISPVTNNPGADPTLPQTFIGSYFQIIAVNGTVYHHFNANYLRQRLNNQGQPVPQQDNYLTTLTYNHRPTSTDKP